MNTVMKKKKKPVVSGVVWLDCNKEQHLGKPAEAAAFQRFGAREEYIHRSERWIDRKAGRKEDF